MSAVDDRNESQTRANQMFDAWEAKQEAKAGKIFGSVPAWGALVLTVGTIVWGAAFVAGDIDDNTRRIAAIEITQKERERDTRLLIERLARIEAKLDILTEKE